MLTFQRKRPRTTDVAKLTRWAAIGVAVVEIVSLLDRRRRFVAVAIASNGNEWVIGRHCSRAAAQRTCERYVARTIEAGRGQCGTIRKEER